MRGGGGSVPLGSHLELHLKFTEVARMQYITIDMLFLPGLTKLRPEVHELSALTYTKVSM
jgi:hypothetical protein